MGDARHSDRPQGADTRSMNIVVDNFQRSMLSESCRDEGVKAHQEDCCEGNSIGLKLSLASSLIRSVFNFRTLLHLSMATVIPIPIASVLLLMAARALLSRSPADYKALRLSGVVTTVTGVHFTFQASLKSSM